MVALPFSEYHEVIKRPPFGSKYVKDPKTLGEHLRKKRMDLHLFQKDTAKLFNVSEECITNWETGRTKPQVQFYPNIISFLGFNPFESNTTTLGQRIRQYRYTHGLSLEAIGKLLDVHATTVGSWESSESKPHFKALKKIEKLINNIK